MSLESAFKLSLITSKASNNGAHYLTLIYRKLKQGNPRTEYISYPAFSKIDNNSIQIKIPVVNVRCEDPAKCVFDLDQFIQHLNRRHSQKTINDSIQCPACPKTVKLNEYLIDYGFEYILRDFEKQPNINNYIERSNTNVGILPNNATLTPSINLSSIVTGHTFAMTVSWKNWMI